MSNEQTLLIEQYDATPLIEVAAEGREKRYILEGICVQTNIKNRNGRIYPKALVQREMQRYITERLNRDQAVGELNHPANRPTIDYERVSHKYTELREDGDNWVGRAVVAHKTPIGSVVAGLMEVGVVLGTSSRARGSTRLHEGANVVQNDFRLITPGDIVYDPSAPDAYLTNLMEGKEWVWANGTLCERESEIKTTVNTLARNRQLNKDSMKMLFEQVMNQIKGESK